MAYFGGEEDKNAERLRNLIVDENEPLRISLAATLEVNDFMVTTASAVSDTLHLMDT
jgi:ActR/RegA family two-component response regulator